MVRIVAVALLACGAEAFLAPSAQLNTAVRSVAVSRSSALHMSTPVVDKDKEEVTEYFNNNGFERWNKIYSDSDEVNAVQKDIRDGHGQTVDKVLAWIDADGDAAKRTFCDAGCGVGSLTIPLGMRGAKVAASDISKAMTTEAAARTKVALGSDAKRITFQTSDLESLSGSYDTVCCIDVMIHYPTDKMTEMVSKLCSMATNRVIISFAPDTWYYTALKAFGGLFPGPSKTTRAYLHKEEAVIAALKSAGFEVQRTQFTGTNFYFSRLLEATRA
ncbi:magnesium-protoporphyrin IX methyltransferase, putative chloroplast precursor [Tribonema minus]|uniref:Magnesium-protoporphyrin IX methyltransferase, putative chloroplast n=1 Tax=Tribonema minus TaxID=303371 RepID=A0A836C7Y3_9STRA|nr:magnesium-protoporphyrin IX methyltransferase, putative chloroplast precursor [Tribonema minus]